MAKRRRTKRSEKEWFKLVSGQEHSGETQERYCRAIGVSPTSFQRWRQRLRDRGRANFIEVEPKEPTAARVEVEVSGGVTLRIWS